MDSCNMEDLTNKTFLLKIHKQDIQKHEHTLDICFTTGIPIIQEGRLTKELRSYPEVALLKENRIDLKNLLKSRDQDPDKPVGGKFLLCRTLWPPMKKSALFTIVDDPDGELGAHIALYNFVPDPSYRYSKEVCQYLPVGTILAIMNPWLQKTDNGRFTIICDNPSGQVVLNQSMVNHIFGNLTWKGQIPSEYHREAMLTSLLVNDKNWKRIGNEHFVLKRFKNAVIAYTTGLKEEENSDNDKLALLANRSAAYLGCCKFDLALIDAESVLAIDKTHIKCVYRKANALFGMEKYQDVLTFLSEVTVGALPNDNQKLISDLIAKANYLIPQSLRGEYPWTEILKNNDCRDLADYKGNVIVKDTLTKGRGLFATEAIKSGQLILASRAFSYAHNKSTDIEPPKREPRQEHDIVHDSLTSLVINTFIILKGNPEKCKEVFNLYSGSKYANDPAELPDDDRVTVDRIYEVCRNNAFCGNGNTETSQTQMKEAATGNRDIGLWLTPSFINHSCVDGNCFWTRKGDFIFFHAFHDIAKDEEILASYVDPHASNYQETVSDFDFTCHCRLCIRDRKDDSRIRAMRTGLLSRLSVILGKYKENTFHSDFQRDDVEMRNIMKSLEDLRKDSPELNLYLINKMELLGQLYFNRCLFLKSATTLEKVYNITANIPPLFHLTFKVCSNLIGSYLLAREIHKVKPWIRTLKAKALLFYGTYSVIEVIFPDVHKLMKNFGLF